MIPASLKANVMLRGGSKARWERMNPILGMREPGLELDTHRFKVGNGQTAWNDLPYWDRDSQDDIAAAVAAYFAANPVMDGADGEIGPQGVQGPKGDKGDRGDAGSQGAVGSQGAKGDVGEKGATGATGPQGPTGATGMQGPKGETGSVGPSGAQGATGPQGAAGATFITNATIAETALSLALLGGVRKVNVTAAGTVPGANYLLFPTGATPSGYAIADVVCVTAGTLQVTMTAPPLALLASYSIPVRVVRINT